MFRPRAAPVISLWLAVPLILVGTLAIFLWQPNWVIAALAYRSPEVLYFANTTEPVVALTIDDGPDPATTDGIMDVLARHGAQATFFLISGRVAGNERVVERIVREGHEIGNHFTRDERSFSLGAAEFEADLLTAHETLSRFGEVRWMRPGWGWYNQSMLEIGRAHGYRCALGSIYPYDGNISWKAYATFQILRKVQPGSVVVLHDIGPRGRRTAAVLERVLPDLGRRGLRVVTLSTLIELAR